MVAVVGWVCFLLGICTFGLTLAVYRVLVTRAFAQRGTYLVRGLLVSVGFFLIWAAIIRGGGPIFGTLGLGAEIGAAFLTRYELHKRL